MPNDRDNPYSAPQTDISSNPGRTTGVIRQEDGLLIVPIGSELPDVCLITGRRSHGRFFDRKLTWAPPWVFIFILFNLLILLIVYLIARKQGRLKYYLDDEVVSKMKNRALFSWIAFPSLIVAMIVGGIYDVPALLVFPLLTLLVLLIVMIVIYPKLRIARIDKTSIHLAKVHPDAMEFILAQQA